MSIHTQFSTQCDDLTHLLFVFKMHVTARFIDITISINASMYTRKLLPCKIY